MKHTAKKSTGLSGVLNGKIDKISGRSLWPASFRMYVGLGNCPVPWFGGQPDALLATDRSNKYRFVPHQRLPCVKGAAKNLFDF